MKKFLLIYWKGNDVVEKEFFYKEDIDDFLTWSREAQGVEQWYVKEVVSPPSIPLPWRT